MEIERDKENEEPTCYTARSAVSGIKPSDTNVGIGKRARGSEEFDNFDGDNALFGVLKERGREPSQEAAPISKRFKAAEDVVSGQEQNKEKRVSF